MPPAKRSSSPKTKTEASKRAPNAKSTTRAAKATATTARKSAGRTSTQAKSAATKTANASRSRSKSTAGAAKTGAKATATSARSGARATATPAKSTATRASKTDTVTLTRERVQSTLDDAAARGRMTRKDANDLVAELMKHGSSVGDEVGDLVAKGRTRLEQATKKVRKAEPVDRIVRGADRARRAAGVGPSFPITGYDQLNVTQVNARLKELSKPDLRKVLTYERKNANRKSVVNALEKAIA